MRWNETAAERIKNDPIVNRLRVPQKHSPIADYNLVMRRRLKSEIFLRERENLRIQFGRFQCRARKCLFEKLIKSSAAETDHEHVLGMGMKHRAASDRRGVGNDQTRRSGESNRRFAIELAAPEAPHLNNRSGLLDRDVIVRRLERQRAYLSETGLAGREDDCEKGEYKTNQSRNWSAAAETHQTCSKA